MRSFGICRNCGDAFAHAVRLHVVGIDRQLVVRRIGHRVRRTDRGVSLERDLVLGFDDFRRGHHRRVRIADDARRRARCRLRGAHEAVEIFGRRERRRRRLLPVHLQLARRLNRLLLALAHHRDVVALAHHLDEAGHVLHRGLVDAHELRARDRRLHVARVQHAGHFGIHRPLQRAIHLRRDVVALRRLADDLELIDVLEPRRARRRVDVAAGERGVELASADQLAIRDALRRIGRDRHDAVADRELRNRHTESRRRPSPAARDELRRRRGASDSRRSAAHPIRRSRPDRR